MGKGKGQGKHGAKGERPNTYVLDRLSEIEADLEFRIRACRAQLGKRPNTYVLDQLSKIEADLEAQ
eukprot:1483045-Lingulodinium_polyedra.AAC.1